MSDFSLEKSRWYQIMMLGNACRHAKNNAELVIKHARLLLPFDYEPVIGTELAQAETALSEALLAVKVARIEYEKNGKPALVAAE